MGSVRYTATESLLAHRSSGTSVEMEIDFQEARRSRKTEKTVHKSEGGAMEVLKHRSEVTWDLTFEPVSGARLEQLREFLDSTEGGELFTIDAYGTAAAPKIVKRIDDGYAEEPFMRIGSEDGDLFEVKITVIEIA